MRTLKDIKTMLAKCGAAIWGTKKEVKELPNIIGDDEIYMNKEGYNHQIQKFDIDLLQKAIKDRKKEIEK